MDKHTRTALEFWGWWSELLLTALLYIALLLVVSPDLVTRAVIANIEVCLGINGAMFAYFGAVLITYLSLRGGAFGAWLDSQNASAGYRRSFVGTLMIPIVSTVICALCKTSGAQLLTHLAVIATVYTILNAFTATKNLETFHRLRQAFLAQLSSERGHNEPSETDSKAE